ncbi:MAG: hypothetical protein SOY30_01680 [Eubacteriales bacterium]|nr:hypothetical protein [Eubacteriales bacterium]
MECKRPAVRFLSPKKESLANQRFAGLFLSVRLCAHAESAGSSDQCFTPDHFPWENGRAVSDIGTIRRLSQVLNHSFFPAEKAQPGATEGNRKTTMPVPPANGSDDRLIRFLLRPGRIACYLSAG